jgi:hypothetical protein
MRSHTRRRLMGDLEGKGHKEKLKDTASRLLRIGRDTDWPYIAATDAEGYS